MTPTASPGCYGRRRARAPATSSRMGREPECSTHSWRSSRGSLPSAASPRCVISFRTWSNAPGGPTHPNLRMRPFGPPWSQPRSLRRHLRWSPGKSFGGRMTSQAQAASPLPGVRGLAFLGFPLHPAGRPSDERAEHLFAVEVPMLFLQGNRDKLAELGLLRPVVGRLGQRATLRTFEEADHSFHVPARTGRKDTEVRAEMLDK